MEKKKILFTARDMKIGGIEKALVTLLNYLIEEYDITLVLEKKEGQLLKKLDYKIKIEEYTPNDSEILILRKTINLFNRIKAIIKYKNKFDTSVSFATYSIPGSFIARIASKNSILWGHMNYLDQFNNDKSKVRGFFVDLNYNKFSKVVFVSKGGMYSFVEVFPDMKNKTFYCNNLIDGKSIENLSKQTIDFTRDNETYLFLNVSRHDERQKKLSRIIEAADKLKDEKYKFKILFIGEGKDTKNYKDTVEKLKLKDEIIFLGKQDNPYPYFRVADCILVSSDYEGYPVVFIESFILNTPVITTNFTDCDDVKDGRGIVVGKNSTEIFNAMKKIIDEGYRNKKFDYNEYNDKIKEKLREILK